MLVSMGVKRLMAVLAVLFFVSLSAGAVEILSVDWNAGLGVMVVELDAFPAWGGWRMWVDGVEVPMEGGDGQPVVRPSAPLDQHPSGLFIATTPWVSPLPAGAMPCTGTLQFEIPGVGLTPAAAYDLTGLMCSGASALQSGGASGGVGGTIRQDTVWSGDVWVTSFVFVPAGVTLTIEPGTTVRFKHYRGYTDPGARLSMRVEGTLKAVGTASDPIWFTSDAPDPMNGDWGMLRLVNASSASEIRFAILEFAQQGLNLWNSSPALSDLIVRWNNWEGIYFESYCRPTLERARIYQNGYNGIAMEQFNDVTIRDCYIAESGTHGIHVDASTATIDGCIVEANAAAGLSVDDHGTLVVNGCLVAENETGIQCGEGANTLRIDAGTVLGGNHTDMPSCPETVTWLPGGMPAPSSIAFPMPDVRPYELGYTPGDRQLDRFQYVYPDSDATRTVVNKIGDGLGLTWSVTWDGSAIWTATLWGDVYRLDPATGAVLTHWTFPGPQAWGMTYDGEHLWINDFAEKKVYQMTTSGTVLGSFTIPDPTGGAKGIAWDGQALCIMGWTSSTIYRVDRQGNLLNTIALQGGGGGLAWDGEAFWVPGGRGIERVSATGQSLGSIYACSEGTWDLTWDGQYLWATQRTNENWFDDKLYQIRIGTLQ
ncbi:right-handed parallel beta-helix repeat-containing protein [Candidatus Bipolaricaulota bacterium]|nr:right-handed parallel beta-helix repeat-containing protein [Candidatus Bipolaricaulota bacterium]